MILVTLTPWCKMVAEAHTHLNRLTAKLGVTWFASKMCQSDQDLEKLFVKTRVVQTLSLWCACCKSLDILIVLISVSILRINNCVNNASPRFSFNGLETGPLKPHAAETCNFPFSIQSWQAVVCSEVASSTTQWLLAKPCQMLPVQACLAGGSTRKPQCETDWNPFKVSLKGVS